MLGARWPWNAVLRGSPTVVIAPPAWNAGFSRHSPPKAGGRTDLMCRDGSAAPANAPGVATNRPRPCGPLCRLKPAFQAVVLLAARPVGDDRDPGAVGAHRESGDALDAEVREVADLQSSPSPPTRRTGASRRPSGSRPRASTRSPRGPVASSVIRTAVPAAGSRRSIHHSSSETLRTKEISSVPGIRWTDRPGFSATIRISPLSASPTWRVAGSPRMNIATTWSVGPRVVSHRFRGGEDRPQRFAGEVVAPQVLLAAEFVDRGEGLLAGDLER